MAKIAAQARARADVASGANDDIADQHGGGMDKCLGIDDRRDAVDRIDSELHGGHFFREWSDVTAVTQEAI